MARPDLAQALAQSALFRALPEGERALLARAAQAQWIDDTGSTAPLMRRGGQDGGALHLVVGAAEDGPLLQVSFDDPGQGAVRRGYRLVAGEVAGDLDLLIAGLHLPVPPRCAFAWALAPHWAVTLPAEAVLGAAERNVAFRRRLIRDAARRFASLLDQRAKAAPLHPDVAFAATLLDLFDDYADPGGPQPGGLRKRFSQRELAGLMGMSLRSFTARLSDWSARGLVETAPLAMLDRDRVEQIAAVARAQDPAAALRQVAGRAAGLIAGGQRLGGAGMAADALEIWPGEPELVFLVALALARSGDGVQAQALVSGPDLRFSGSIGDLRTRVAATRARALGADAEDDIRHDPGLNDLCRDIAALQARLAKDRALDLPPGPARDAALGQAADLYAAVDASLPSAFSCVNAASLRALAGATEAAQAAAGRALALASGPATWDMATRAEAELILGRADRAKALYLQAASGAVAGEVAVMRRQLAHLAAGGIAGAAACLAATEPGPVLVLAGPILARGTAPEADLAAAADALARDIAGHLADRRPSALICALASGADLIAARAAVARGVPVDAVLPFALPAFEAASVAVGGGRDWVAELRLLLPDLRSLTVLWDGEAPAPGWPGHFRRTTQVLLGEALLAARSLCARAEVLAIGPDGSEAAALARLAEAAGITAQRWPSPLDARRAGAGGGGGAGQTGRDPFAGVVLVLGPDDSPATRAWLEAQGLRPRATKARRLMGECVLPDLTEAAALARRLAGPASGVGARVILDHGPVRTRSGTTDPEALARLAARHGGMAAAWTGRATASAAAGLALLGMGADPARVTEVVFEAHPDARGAGAGQATRRLFRLI